MTFFHVLLADRTHTRPTIDMTPGRDLSYRDARAILIEFERLFPSLHESGCPSYLQIMPVAIGLDADSYIAGAVR